MIAAPFLQSKDICHTRLKQLTWISNKTVRPSLLHASAGSMLLDLLPALKRRPLSLDCTGITGIQDHAFDAVAKAIREVGSPVVFSNAHAIAAELPAHLGSPDLAVRNDVLVYGGQQIEAARALELVDLGRELETNLVREKVRACFRAFERGMHRNKSTPLLASGVFDARLLIADPQVFRWIALRMNDLLREQLRALAIAAVEGVRAEAIRPIRLLAVSLRGSPLAAAVSILHGLEFPIEIVDHVGPKHRILEEDSIRPRGFDGDYILVSDFVVGGTELKVAQAYARQRGGVLRHALVIGTALEPSLYGTEVGLSALVNLFEVCPEFRVQFMGGDLDG